MEKIATLDSIDTYASTVDFLIKNFSDKEFTSKEYDEKRNYAEDVFSFGTVKKYSPEGRSYWKKVDVEKGDLVYRTKVKEFIVPHKEDEKPIVGKRYYYRVSPMIHYAVLAQKKKLAKQLQDEENICMLESRIFDLSEQLKNAQKRLARMKDFVKEYGE